MENLLRFGYDDSELITGLSRSEAAVDGALSRMQSRLTEFSAVQNGIGRAPGSVTGNGVGFGQTSVATFNIAGNATRELEGLTSRSEQFSRSLDKITKQFSGGLGLGLSLGGFALFEGVLERSIQKARQFETAQISIAAAMSSISKRVDATTGRPLSGSENFDANMREAGRIRADILAKSGRTILTFQEQLGAFQSSINPGARKGLSIKDTEEVSEQASIVAKTLGLKGEQLANASRLLMGGGVNIARSTIGRALGIDNTDIAIRSGKELKSFLLERMSGFKDAEDAFANSIEGQMSTIESRIDTILARAGTSFLKKVSPVLQNLFSGVEEPEQRPGESKSDFDQRVKDHSKNAAELEQVVDSLSAAFTGVFKAIQTVVQSDAFAAFAHFLESVAGYADKIVLAAIFFKIAGAIKDANGQLSSFVAAMGEMTSGAMLTGFRNVGTPASQALARNLAASRVTQAAQVEQAAMRQAVDQYGPIAKPLVGPSPTAQALGYGRYSVGTNFGRYMNRQEQMLEGETSHWEQDNYTDPQRVDRYLTPQQQARQAIAQAEARLSQSRVTRAQHTLSTYAEDEEGNMSSSSYLTDEGRAAIAQDVHERRSAARELRASRQFLRENPVGFTDDNAGISESLKGDTVFGKLFPEEVQKDYVTSVREEAKKHYALTNAVEQQRKAALQDVDNLKRKDFSYSIGDKYLNPDGTHKDGYGSDMYNSNMSGAFYSPADFQSEIESRKLKINSDADKELAGLRAEHLERRAAFAEEARTNGETYQARNMAMDRQQRTGDRFADSIEAGITNTYNNPESGIARGAERRRLLAAQREAFNDFHETRKAAMLEFEPLTSHIASGIYKGDELEQALHRQSNLASVISKSEAGMSSISPAALPFMARMGVAGRNLADNVNRYGQFAMLGVLAGSAVNDKAAEQESDIGRYGGRFLGGGIQGLSIGATIGSAIPGVGTAVGAGVGFAVGGAISMLTGKLNDMGEAAKNAAKNLEDARQKFPVFGARYNLDETIEREQHYKNLQRGFDDRPASLSDRIFHPTAVIQRSLQQIDNAINPDFMARLSKDVVNAQTKLHDAKLNTISESTVNDITGQIKGIEAQKQTNAAFADSISRTKERTDLEFRGRMLQITQKDKEKDGTILGYSESDYVSQRKRDYTGVWSDDIEDAYRKQYEQRSMFRAAALRGELVGQQRQQERGANLQQEASENGLQGNTAVSQILSKVAEVEAVATKYADKGGIASTEYQRFATQAFSEIYKNATRDLRTSGLELQDTALTNRKQGIEDFYTLRGMPRQEETLRLSAAEATRNIETLNLEAAEVQLNAAELKISGEKLGLKQDELNLKRDQFNSRSTALVDADAPAHLAIKGLEAGLQHQSNLADMRRISHEMSRLPIEERQIAEDRQQQILQQQYAAREHPLTQIESQIKYRQADREAYSAAQGDKQALFYGGLGPVSDAASAIRYGVEAKYARNFNPKAYAAAYDRSLQNQVANMDDEAQLAQVNKARAAIALDKVETDYAQSVQNAARAMDALTERSYALAMKQGDLARSYVSAGLKDEDEGMTSAEDQARGEDAIRRRPLERDFERRNLDMEQRGLDIDRDKYGISQRRQALTEAGLPDKIEASKLSAAAARDAYAKYVAEEPILRGAMAINQQRAKDKFDKQSEDYQDKEAALERLRSEIPNTINLNAVIKDERMNAQDRAELKQAIQKGVDDGIANYVKNCERRNKIN